MRSTRSIITLLSAFFLLQLCACRQSCIGTSGGYIYFAGFDSASLEKVVCKIYSAGSGFNNPAEMHEYLLSDTAAPLVRYDTANGYIIWPYDVIRISYGKDYQIDIPNAGLSVRISDIKVGDEKSDCSGGLIQSGADACACINTITSYNLNGVTINTGRSKISGTYNFSEEIDIHR